VRIPGAVVHDAEEIDEFDALDVLADRVRSRCIVCSTSSSATGAM